MNKILVLWAVPRSTSTAFEWMMRMRGDMECFHEPFGEPWYQGEVPMWPRFKEGDKTTPGLTLDVVWERMKQAAKKGSVFSKEFPIYIKHWWDTDFLDYFKHSFLLRNPALALPSLNKSWPQFLIEETNYIEQRQLFDLLCDRYGEAPPIIDSCDILEDPHTMVECYCNAVGIPFIESALRWEPGARDEVSWWDGGTFHANLRDSDGLKPQPKRHGDISTSPDWVKRIYDEVYPHYDYLYQQRIKNPKN